MNWTLLFNSLALALLATAGCLFLGVWVALAWSASGKTIRKAVLLSAALVMVMPSFIVLNCWIYYFGQNGLWTAYIPLKIYSFPGTLVMMILVYWPITTLLVAASLNGVSASHLEQEPGLRGFKLFYWVIFPEIKGAVQFAALLSFVLVLNNFSVPALLQTKVYASEIWVQFNTFYSFRGAFLTSLPFILLTLVFLSFLRSGGFRRISVSDLGGGIGGRLGFLWVWGGLSVFLVLSLAGLFLPVFQLFFGSGAVSQLPQTARAGMGTIGFTLFLSAACAVLIIFLAALVRVWKIDSFLWVLFVIPGVLLGVCCIWLFNRPELNLLYQSPLLIFGLLTLKYLSLGKTGLRFIFDRVDKNLEQMMQSMGIRGWCKFRRVVFPQHGQAIMALAYLVYLFVLWDVETMLMIVPPGMETVSLRIFNLLHYGHNVEVDALCLILLGIALLPPVLFQLAVACRRFFPVFTLGTGILLLSVFSGCKPQDESLTGIEGTHFRAVKILGDRGNGVGQFNKPRSIALDNEDNLFVADITGRVQKFDRDGKFLLGWQMPQTDQGRPKGMCRDLDGNILLVEPHYSRVNQFDPGGKLLSQWGRHGTNWGWLSFPRAVAVNSVGKVFISEYGVVERIQFFDLQSKAALGGFGSAGTKPGEFNRPEGLTVDSKDRLLVCDSCNHRIQVFGPDGRFEMMFGTAGNGPGELSYPYDIQVDHAGRIYVCEFGNSRIQIFDSSGRSLEVIGGPGRHPGEFNNPTGVALDRSGNLYVADSMNHRVQKLVSKASMESFPSVTRNAARPAGQAAQVAPPDEAP